MCTYVALYGYFCVGGIDLSRRITTVNGKAKSFCWRNYKDGSILNAEELWFRINIELVYHNLSNNTDGKVTRDNAALLSCLIFYFVHLDHPFYHNYYRSCHIVYI